LYSVECAVGVDVDGTHSKSTTRPATLPLRE